MAGGGGWAGKRKLKSMHFSWENRIKKSISKIHCHAFILNPQGQFKEESFEFQVRMLSHNIVILDLEWFQIHGRISIIFRGLGPAIFISWHPI